MKPLSEEILSTAFRAPNGEYGWRFQNIEVALRAIGLSGQAILGGQFWAVEDGKFLDFISSGDGEAGFKMWDTTAQDSTESWSDYCQRTVDESIQELEKIKLEDAIPAEFRDFLFINPTFVEELDIRSLIPRHKHDHERAGAAIAASYPAVEPILFELLEWLQDLNWPVAQDLAPFLAGIGKPLIPHIRRIFETDDEIWKYWIMGVIMNDSIEVAEAFREEIYRIAYAPTERELGEELHEQAQSLLKKYGWAK